ncbi:MAG: DUF4268 domain-containing protein [Capnocytophaga sp.]|nr:MAG: DUF4268 domain-containing protein [Capnocytophaga sp.]
MYSKEESSKLREEFWTSFGKSFPRKWILYRTGVKEILFKFYFDTKKAMVCIDIEGSLDSREKYFTKMESLRDIFSDFLPDNKYEKEFVLENGKEISRIWIEKKDVCIHNKATWQETMEFFVSNMSQIELFWQEYEDLFKEDVF